MKKTLLFFALLCAFAQGAWAQTSLEEEWQEVLAMTQTTSSNWNVLHSGSTTGHWFGSDGNTTYYRLGLNNTIYNFTNYQHDGSGATIHGTVYLYVPTGITVNFIGANANETNGAGAGIELNEGNTLILLGGGTINATGGNAANGGNGGNGNHSYFVYDNYCQPGSGGNGGNGGGGAGAGIGTRGGNGGTGGSGATAKRDENEGTNKGVDGSVGNAGTTSGAMGNLYVVSSTVNLNASGGAAGSNGSGGARGYNAAEDPYNHYDASGGGGGGAGGFGGAASNIGTGGPGGGGGGGGAAGNSAVSYTSGFLRVGAGGGYGGKNGDGSSAANGTTSELTNPYDAEYNQGLSGTYPDRGWEDGNGMHSGGSGGACGSASTSGSAINIVLWPTSGAGTAESPYLINNADDWNTFAANVTNGITYSGKVIKLTSNISVTTMAGGVFCGTFDGDGNTITANINGGGASTALFGSISGGTIKNLTVAGSISGGIHTAALVVSLGNGGTNIVENCVVTATINCSSSHMGGFLAHGNTSNITIRGCVFNGLMTGGGTAKGVFFGWGDNGGTRSVTNCLYIMADGQNTDGLDLARMSGGTVTVNNCYKTTSVGSLGTASYFSTATAPNSLGDLVTDYGMVKAYANGLFFNDQYYTASNSGAGSQSCPYIIDSRSALAQIAYYVNSGETDFLDKHFSLICDLNLSGQNWTPIGTTDRPFKGNFNGNNHIIRSMAVNNPSGDYNGLFGWVEGDINYETNWTDPGSKYIKNFVVKNANVHGRNYTGGVAGRVHGELTFENVILDGATVQGANFTSGFIGSAEGDYQQSLYISNYSELHLNNCLFVNGSVTENTGHEGYDYVAPDHPHTSFVMFGNIQRYAIFNNNYFSNVTYNGGAAPEDYYNVQAYPITPDVSSNVSCNIYNTTGLSYNGSLYAPNNTTAHFSVYTQDLAQVITGVSVNGTQVGTISGDYAFTVDSSQAQAYTITVALSATGITGSGDSEDDPYLITNTDQWNAFANYVSSGNNLGDKFVRLDANIDISQTIGLRSDKPFSGTFLGNGHTITASISSTTTGSGANEQGVAPFHYINGATIKDLTVAGSIASASYHTSGLVGFADGTNTIENCLVTATLNISSNYAGGIIGHGLNSNITIEGCVFAGTINGVDGDRSNIGGIWGWSDSGTPTLVSCLEAGTYTNIASMHPMGLQKNKGSITNCYYVNPQVGSPTNACTVSGAVQAVTDAEILPVGNPVAYNVSGITAYTNGISYGGNFYYNPDRNIKREITGYGEGTGKWAFIASPVEGSIAPSVVTNLLGSAIPETNPVQYNYDLFRLNSEQWENYVQHTGDFNIVNGNGYLYATQTTKNLVFSGIFNTDDSKTVELSDGFNLVGNPFGVDAYVSKPFYQMNDTGTDIEPIDNYDTYNPVTIPPCTGIVVRASGADEVTFSTSAPQQQASANNGNLQMTLTKAGVRSDAFQDKAIVSFNEGSELEKFVFNERNAKLYIPQDGEDYAIAFSDKRHEVPVNFKATKTGRYTITFEGDNLNGISLIDKIENVEIDLGKDVSGNVSTYTFIGSSVDDHDRFLLVFKNSEFSDNSEIFAYQSGNDIIVSGNGDLQVFDVMGRMVMNQYINGVQTCHGASLQTGVYIFKLNEKTQKIVVR